MSSVSPKPQSSGQAPPTSVGLTVLGVAVVVGAPTVLAAFLSAWLGNGLGWFFNVVFFVASVVGALRVRRGDFLAAVIIPPLAYAGAIVLASGKLGGTGGLILRAGSTLGEFLTVGAPWLFGATLAAFVIVVVRGRLGR